MPVLGESAKGKYPVQSILMMDKILEQTEQFGNTRDQPLDVKPSGLCPQEGMAYVSGNSHLYCITMDIFIFYVFIDEYHKGNNID